MNRPVHLQIWETGPIHGSDGRLWPWRPCAVLPYAEAHRIARRLRKGCPVVLVAVRPASAGEPLWPPQMVDHYDLPPYAD